MKYLSIAAFFIISLFITPVPVFSADLDVLEIARRTQQVYESTSSFKADFRQTSSITGIRHRDRKGSGTMVIQKPGLLRWDYSSPDRQVLVSDGEEFSLYFAAENQMIVTPARQYLQEDVTYNFFSGSGEVLRDFDVSIVPANIEKEGSYAIRLIPKKAHGQVQLLYIWVDKSTFRINHLQILDHLGSTTDLHFYNMVVNEPFSKDFFHFIPPEGTEIIRQ